MAKIETVDYKDLASKAKQIRAQAQDLNKELLSAYQHIIDMHKSWYGKRYNDLAKDFNNLAPSINEVLKLTVREIPFALETVANNYSTVNEGSKATSAQQTSEKKMTTVPQPNDIGMRFLTQEVTQIKKLVEDNFKKSVAKMNTIESIYNKITWRSEAADAFRLRFTKLKKQITEDLGKINAQFGKLMQQALDDIQTTEKKNTVN